MSWIVLVAVIFGFPILIAFAFFLCPRSEKNNKKFDLIGELIFCFDTLFTLAVLSIGFIIIMVHCAIEGHSLYIIPLGLFTLSGLFIVSLSLINQIFGDFKYIKENSIL